MNRNSLHDCAKRNDLGNARRLIARGNGVNGRDGQGRTPLMRAAAQGNVRMCDLLYLNGAQLDATDDGGKTARDHAPQWGRRWFDAAENRDALRQQDPRAGLRDAFGRTELHWAALEGDAGQVRTLLNAGADPSVADDWGRTALYCAAMAGSASAAEALIGADALALEAADQLGQSVMHAAMIGKNVDTVRLFRQRGVELSHATDRCQVTPIMVAAELGWADGIREMAEAGAEVDAWDIDGNSAIIRAAVGGHAGAYRALAEAGGDVGARKDADTHEEVNCLDLAVMANSPAAVEAVFVSWLAGDRVPVEKVVNALRGATERMNAVSDTLPDTGDSRRDRVMIHNMLDVWGEELARGADPLALQKQSAPPAPLHGATP